MVLCGHRANASSAGRASVFKPAINVPFTDDRIRRLRLSIEGNETLLIAFDPSLFHHDWSGTMEYRFRTSQAKAFLAMLRERTAWRSGVDVTF